MTSSLLLGICTPCGEPIFRHRIGRRQITCESLRRLDQALKSSGAPTEQVLGSSDEFHRESDARGAEAVR